MGDFSNIFKAIDRLLIAWDTLLLSCLHSSSVIIFELQIVLAPSPSLYLLLLIFNYVCTSRIYIYINIYIHRSINVTWREAQGGGGVRRDAKESEVELLHLREDCRLA